MPRFLWMDFKKKTIDSTEHSEADLSTTIERMEHVDGKLILQGAEDALEDVRDGVGWTIAISEETGEMVLTASGDEVGFVVFCSCASY